MGITVSTVQEELAEQQDMYYPGVVVVSVEKNGPGDKAGLKSGDVITKIGDTRVTTTRELSNAKNEYRVGETVILEVYRAKRVIELSITFGSSR
jgi:serine protease Do